MQPKLEEVNYDSLRERRLDDQKYLGGDIYESFFKSPHRQAHKYSDGNMVIPNVDLN